MYGCEEGVQGVEAVKTIRVRIAVAVTPNGCWNTHGAKLLPEWRLPEADAQQASQYLFSTQGHGRVVFVECDVPVPDPVPEPPTIEGTVTP